MNERNAAEKKRRRFLNASSSFSYMLIMIILFTVGDMIRDIRTDASAYELRFEDDETFQAAGSVYRLYVNDKYYDDVDYNRFCLLDETGNTDYKYCVLVQDASNLTYILIICSMFFFVIKIANNSMGSTPFTRENIKLVKVISILQLLLGVLPGVVRMIMTMLRFSYYHGTFDVNSMFLLAISFVIAMIAFIFEKGLALQEDVDSIA
jgi:hypothetical protein